MHIFPGQGNKDREFTEVYQDQEKTCSKTDTQVFKLDEGVQSMSSSLTIFYQYQELGYMCRSAETAA